MPPTCQKDAMKPGFPLAEIDTTTPHPARMYDAYLGSKDPLGSGVVVEDLGEQAGQLVALGR